MVRLVACEVAVLDKASHAMRAFAEVDALVLQKREGVSPEWQPWCTLNRYIEEGLSSVYLTHCGNELWRACSRLRCDDSVDEGWQCHCLSQFEYSA